MLQVYRHPSKERLWTTSEIPKGNVNLALSIDRDSFKPALVQPGGGGGGGGGKGGGRRSTFGRTNLNTELKYLNLRQQVQYRSD